MKKVAIIGFGNQAKSWALNLRDSGIEPIIFLRPQSSSFAKVKALGLKSEELGHKLSEHQIFALLTPDHTHYETLKTYKSFFNKNARIIYAHGYSYEKDELAKNFPSLNHLLLAPKAIASELRFNYETNAGLGAFYSLENIAQENKEEIFKELKEIAKGIGINTGPFETTFSREAKSDLFSEQGLLCSVLPYAALNVFNKMRENGASAELAYFESWYEMKLIADTLVKLGPYHFFQLISPNALIGSENGKEALLGKEFQSGLNSLSENIENNSFYSEFTPQKFEDKKKEILEFWQTQELTKTHNILSTQLFKTGEYRE